MHQKVQNLNFVKLIVCLNKSMHVMHNTIYRLNLCNLNEIYKQLPIVLSKKYVIINQICLDDHYDYAMTGKSEDG